MDQNTFYLAGSFMRLWGQTEARTETSEDEDISDSLKAWDDAEAFSKCLSFAEEYAKAGQDTDLCSFFDGKVNELL